MSHLLSCSKSKAIFMYFLWLPKIPPRIYRLNFWWVGSGRKRGYLGTRGTCFLGGLAVEVKQRARYIHHELLNKPTKEDGDWTGAWKKVWKIESTNQYVLRDDRWLRGLRHPRCRSSRRGFLATTTARTRTRNEKCLEEKVW